MNLLQFFIMKSRLNELKKTIFYEMLDIAGRAFVVARYSENVIIGNRGFTQEEKKNGIVLVFNKSMNFTWDEYGITSNLVFGTSPQKCFVPVDDIVAIYSPELQSQFVTAPKPEAEAHDGEETEGTTGPNVVKVDFSKKRRSRRERPAGGGKSNKHGS
ncbi:MAG TPA: ClpXP protease specificity-enhancing factor SspB [Thermodesulfovibrionales bacterium]|nr:ClpXP protease specificity-enhancing factor SspB [Thermodesulfovibrionales bacterium]